MRNVPRVTVSQFIKYRRLVVVTMMELYMSRRLYKNEEASTMSTKSWILHTLLVHKLPNVTPSDPPSTARVSPCHTPQQCDCGGRVGRGPQRDCIVVCSYLLINPQ